MKTCCDIRTVFAVSCFSCFCLFTSCKKDPPVYDINNLNGNEISVFGHAGMGLEFKYPIDTYESIEPVLRIGADGCEIDLQMTKDSILVLFHNTKLEEMTLCTTGKVNEKLWSEIWGCHIASPYSYKVNLVSFSGLMDELSQSGKNIYDYIFTFDCKLYQGSGERSDFHNQYANAVLKVMDEFDMSGNIFIESQDTTFLRLIQNKRKGLKLFIYPPDFETGLAIANKMKLFGITIANENVSAVQVKRAHDAGKRITIWGTGTENENVQALEKSPDYIQTDKPIHLLQVFDKYKN